MCQVLGTMYDKYETFNLCLYNIVQSPAFDTSPAQATALNPITVNQGLVSVRISGFQFINNGYNVTTRNNTTSAFLTSYLMSVNATGAGVSGILTPMFNPTIITFGKGVECIDINITMKKTIDQTLPAIANATALGTFVFMFKIYGIPTREPNLITNGSRMDIASSR